MLLLTIDYDKTKILSVKEKLIEGWNRHNIQRSGIHVSDLLMCRRQVCFQRLDDNPKLTEKTIRYFQNGLSWHHVIEHLLGPDFECEKEYVYKGIIAHPDAVYRKDGQTVVIEIKTTEKISDTLTTSRR